MENKYGQLETSCWTDVLSKPEIIGLKDVGCLPGESATFNVSVEANPKPKITWTRGNENLCNNSNCDVIFDVDAERYSLVFHVVRAADTGPYMLTAVNTEGTTAQEFKLNVHGKLLYINF